MLKRNVVVGRCYVAKVSGWRVRVKITAPSTYGGWTAVNQATGREIRIKTAGRLSPAVDYLVRNGEELLGEDGWGLVGKRFGSISEAGRHHREHYLAGSRIARTPA